MEIRLARARVAIGRDRTRVGDGAMPFCDTTVELDMHTLVWTRGEAFPLDQLASRFKCPNCALMRVRVYFDVPNQPNAGVVANGRPGA